jgi:hypothetical protein
MKSMRSILSLFLLSGAILFFSCNGVFPTQTKETVPSDHTTAVGGFLHTPALRQPTGEGGCTGCHGQDLKGGVAESSAGKTVAPSCYECHGALWEGGGSGESD